MTKLPVWKQFEMKETEQQQGVLKWNSNPGELKPPSSTFPSRNQLQKILSIKKNLKIHIKWHYFKSHCSLQLIKHFQARSYFERCRRKRNVRQVKLFPWIPLSFYCLMGIECLLRARLCALHRWSLVFLFESVLPLSAPSGLNLLCRSHLNTRT